jgi:hypothetical protein
MALQKHRQKKKEKYKSPGSPHKGETAFSTTKALAIGEGKKDAKKLKKLIKQLGEKTVISLISLGGFAEELLSKKTGGKLNKKGGKVK